MGMSEYYQKLRRCVGKDTLLVPAAAALWVRCPAIR